MRNADDRAVSSFAKPDAIWVPKHEVYRRYSFGMPIKLTVSYTCRHLYVWRISAVCTAQCKLPTLNELPLVLMSVDYFFL